MTADSNIKKVLVVFRKDSDEAFRNACEASQWLKKKDITCFSHPDQNIPDFAPVSNLVEIDLVLVLGGDGTYLEAVRLLNGLHTPILGINMGSLGFLTITTKDQMYSTLEKALHSELEQKQRSMLVARVGDKSFTALNDIVLERGAQSQLLFLRVYSGPQLVSEIKCDGLIFSTPTGSTAYNLAAGGPILHPDVKGYSMTPICPHSLTNRPTIFPSSQNLVVEVKNANQSAMLAIDGKRKLELSKKEKVEIKVAECLHTMLRPAGFNYFDLLREKLRFGQRN